VYKNFAASKMSQAVKPKSMVEFTDFMGRKHIVAVKNNTESKKQMAFFAMLKKESLTISQIISEYPTKQGKIVKKYLPQVRNELKQALNLTKKQIDIVLG
jgi:glycine cleavage system aminomethyltransferase T